MHSVNPSQDAPFCRGPLAREEIRQILFRLPDCRVPKFRPHKIGVSAMPIMVGEMSRGSEIHGDPVPTILSKFPSCSNGTNRIHRIGG